MKKVWLTVIAVLLLLIAGLVFYKLHIQPKPADLSKTPETALLAQVALWYPSAGWSSPKIDKQTTLYGSFTGESMQATIKSDKAFMEHYENADTLKQMGFLPDTNLSADGPGSSSWGYSNITSNSKQLIIFSYRTKPTNTNPNEPAQFTCPCDKTISVFVSLSSTPTQATHVSTTPTLSSSGSTGVQSGPTLANPASVNCTNKGGTLLIKKRGDGGEYGLCDFGDNMQCEEWALFRGDCPVGGRKTTGFDTIDQKYCAWLGGSTYAVENATCQLPNGHNCLDTDLYNGTCQ